MAVPARGFQARRGRPAWAARDGRSAGARILAFAPRGTVQSVGPSRAPKRRSRLSARRRIALVFPRTRYQTGDPPLGVAYLAAVLHAARPRFEIRVVDGTFLGGKAALLRAVRDTNAEVVGVFVDSLMVPQAHAVAAVAHEMGAFALAGGPAASVAPHALMPPFDAVLRGEGEGVIVDLVDRALAREGLAEVPNLVFRGDAGETVETPRAARRVDPDALPHPAWEQLDMPRYLQRWPYLDSLSVDAIGTNVVGSRGCPYACSYCQPTLRAVFGKQVRRRSPESITEEITVLQRRYGIDGVFFHDDTITMHHEWLGQLCEALARLERPLLWGCNSRVEGLHSALLDQMVDAGMRSIHLGVEAGSQRVREDILRKRVDLDELERIVTHLRRRGAHALGFFMLGSPTETFWEMLQTVRLARRLRLTEATFSLTAAIPGTHLHDDLRDDPRFAVSDAPAIDYYNRRNFADRQRPRSGDLARALQLVALPAFYLHPRRADYVRRHLTTRRGLSKLVMKAARFLQPFGERFRR